MPSRTRHTYIALTPPFSSLCGCGNRGLQLRVVGAAVVAASVRSLIECPIGPSRQALPPFPSLLLL